MTIKCLKCLIIVREGQEAISCDICEGWTHRLCGTRVSKKKYEEADRTGASIPFTCITCRASPRESSRIDASNGSLTSMMREITGAVTFDVNLSSVSSVQEDAVLDADNHHISDIMDQDIDERSLEEDAISSTVDEIQENADNSWTVLQTGTQMGKKRLVDSFGFTYVVKRENTKQTNWRCSVRNKKTTCPATVVQKGTEFTASGKTHNHTANPGKLQSTQVRIKIKEDAQRELFRSASTIVEDAVSTIVEPDAPSGARDNMEQLVRIANRAREKNRPRNPQDLDFEISTTAIPVGFLKADITNKDQRHLVLATDRQLIQLSKARQWFLDGTFKVVKLPFYQLLSIHAFVKSNQDFKMMPLAFVVMSARRKSDYVKVFKTLLDLLPTDPAVQKIVMDFEAATWAALRVTLPGVLLRGCLFHYTQAVWRKIQEIGLTVAYRKKDSVFQFVRKLMALPFIPASEIRPTFEELAENVTSSQKMQQLLNYMRTQWMYKRTCPPSSLSSYGQSTRTNNYIEGWHRRFNNKVGEQQLGLYKLIKALHREASLLPIQILLIRENKLTARVRGKSTAAQRNIFALWAQYKSRKISVQLLLTKVSRLHGPSRHEADN